MYIVLRISLLLILTKCNYYLHLFFCHQSPVWVHSTGKQVCNRWYDHDLVWKVNPWQVQLLGSGTLGSITTFWESVVCQCLYETELYSFDCTLTCVSFGLISILSFCLLSPPGHTGRFIKVVFCTSLLFVLAHICFQTVLYTYPPLNIVIGDNCSQWDTITRHIGLSRYVN